MHVHSGKEVEALIDLYHCCSPSENEVSAGSTTWKMKERGVLGTWRLGHRVITLLVMGGP